MRVLFVVARLDYADHIAVAYLSAVAKKLGWDTAFCNLETDDFNRRLRISNFSWMLASFAPKVVAYSANIMGFQKLVEAHKSNAKLLTQTVSIMGGPHPTVSPETFLESGMDAYCIGEGEGAFKDFLIAVERDQSIHDIPNLITKCTAHPGWQKNEVRPTIKNLDSLPMPDRDLTIANSFLKDIPKKTFYTTRGCPYSCTYCCNNYYHALYKGKGPIVRRFSVERVIQEMEHVKNNYRMDFIKIGDDLFATKADDWLEEFSDKYSKRIGVPFNCYLRFDRVDDALLSLLKKAGCFSTHLSVDSTSEYLRNVILKRNMREVDIVDTLKQIESYGIHTLVNFMLNIPESTLQDDLDAMTVCREAKVTYPSFGTTDPMKGTELFDYCAKKGYIDPATHEGNMFGMFDRSTLSCFTKKEKDITHNIHLLGPTVTKLPGLWWKIGLWLIWTIPPNWLFQKIHNWFYNYSMTHTIFKLPKGKKTWKIKNQS